MLQNLMRKMKRDNKGFTLVELMIVVVIIGILIAIAIPVYTNIRSNAETKACQANLRSIGSMLEVYRADDAAGNGSYPAAQAAFNTFTGNYFQSTPICPVGTAVYTYTLANNVPSVVCPNLSNYSNHTLAPAATPTPT